MALSRLPGGGSSLHAAPPPVSQRPPHLAVEGEEPEAADGGEEEQRDGNLDDVGGHHAELLEPHGQLVGEPGGRRGDALRLVVVGESWGDSRGSAARLGAGEQLGAGRAVPRGPSTVRLHGGAAQSHTGHSLGPGAVPVSPLPRCVPPRPATPRGGRAPLTCEPPPGGAAAGQLHHAGGEHEAEEQPAHQPEGDAVVGAPCRRAPLEEAQGGHQHAQEARFQQEAVPAGTPQSHTGTPGPRPRGAERGRSPPWVGRRHGAPRQGPAGSGGRACGG